MPRLNKRRTQALKAAKASKLARASAKESNNTAKESTSSAKESNNATRESTSSAKESNNTAKESNNTAKELTSSAKESTSSTKEPTSSILGINWNDKAQSKDTLYRRGANYSSRQQSRINSANKKKAEGCKSITSFFANPSAIPTILPVAAAPSPPVVVEETITPVVKVPYKPKKTYKFLMTDVQSAFEEISKLIVPVMNITSDQQKAGTYEMAKHSSVYHYLGCLLLGMRKIDASNRAAVLVWTEALATTNRATTIRKWGEEFLSTRQIRPSMKGKHPKRGLSVLTNKDIKKRSTE